MLNEHARGRHGHRRRGRPPGDLLKLWDATGGATATSSSVTPAWATRSPPGSASAWPRPSRRPGHLAARRRDFPDDPTEPVTGAGGATLTVVVAESHGYQVSTGQMFAGRGVRQRVRTVPTCSTSRRRRARSLLSATICRSTWSSLPAARAIRATTERPPRSTRPGQRCCRDRGSLRPARRPPHRLGAAARCTCPGSGSGRVRAAWRLRGGSDERGHG